MADLLRRIRRRRLIRAGDSYTIDEENRGEIELEQVTPYEEPAEEPSEPWLREAIEAIRERRDDGAN